MLIKWQGLPDCENTWEPFRRITTQFPNSHLEDKVSSSREGIDKLAVPLTCVKRRVRTQGKKVKRIPIQSD